MLKTIKDTLRTMGEGFKFANAGEMMPDDQKGDVLSQRQDRYPASTGTLPPRVVLAGGKEFALEAVENAIVQCRKKMRC